MEEDSRSVKDVPYIVYESAQARQERTIKRLVIALIIAIIAIVLTNGAWLYEWTRYDYVSETSTTETNYAQDGGGVNVIGYGNRVE